MDCTRIVNVYTVLTVMVVLLSLVAADAQLEFIPVNTSLHREGEIVKIICSSEKSTMDILRIYKEVGNEQFPVATEGILTPPFQETKRYAMMVTSDGGSRRSVEMTIENLQGEDSGTIQCVHVPLGGEETTAIEEFKVLVAPKKVEILAYSDGLLVPVGERVVLHEGKDHGLACYVVADGTEDEPTTTLTLMEKDGSTTDVLGMFVKEQNHSLNANNGLVQMKKSILYQHLTNKEPDADKLHGRKLTCTSSLPGMPSKSASADIEVRFGPKMECQNGHTEMNQDTVITCSAKMHPPLELASVSWNNNEETVTLTRDSPEMDRFSFEVKNTSLIDYEFSLFIKGVVADDIKRYNFEITNPVNNTRKKVKLMEVQTTTSSTTSKATEKPPVDEPHKTGYSTDNGASHVGSSSVLLVVMAAFLSTRS